MSNPIPIRFMWKDGAMHPERRMAEYCQREFGEGEIVTMLRHEDRSDASHRHYFAAIHEAWSNLPVPAEGDEEPMWSKSPEHLRHWALIKAGYCDVNDLVCMNNDQANIIAAFVKSMNPYAIIVVKGDVIRRYIAKSQSIKAMNRQEFEESKRKVLDVIATLLDISRSRLEANAGRSA